jgi:hypothetical protein
MRLAKKLKKNAVVFTKRSFLSHIRNTAPEDCVNFTPYILPVPIPVAAQSKAWSAAAHLLGLRIRILESWRGLRCLSVVTVVFCEVEVNASGRSLARGVLQSVLYLSVIVKPL